MKALLPALLLALAVAAPLPALANAPRVPVARPPLVFDGRVVVRMAPTEAASLRLASPRGLARMRTASAIVRAP